MEFKMEHKKIMIQDKELEVLFELQDSKYGNIKRCLAKNKIVYVIQGEITEDKEIIDQLEIKYGFMIPSELKNIIY